MKNLYHLPLTCLLIISSFIIDAQTVVDIRADRDNTIYSESGSRSNGDGEYIFVGRTGGGPNPNDLRRALIHFDLSSIPTNVEVTDVSLELRMNKTRVGSQNITVHRVTADWGEAGSDGGSQEGGGGSAQSGDATWTQRMFGSENWSSNGGDFDASSSASTSVGSSGSYSWSSVQLVADVQDWIDGNSPNFGWLLKGNESSRSAKRFNSRNASTASNRPTITITYNLTVPVELISFNAREANGEVFLDWSTAVEINNQGFEVQRSHDLNEWQILDFVEGEGNSNKLINYQFTDSQPLHGLNYYRLKQIDYDGQFEIFDVVSISIQRNFIDELDFLLYPNPTSDLLTLDFEDVDKQGITKDYKLFDLLGRVMASDRTFVNFGQEQINLANLPTGLYFLKIEDLPVVRIIKQHK